MIDVGVEANDGGWVATVRVQHDGASTHHRVTVREEDLRRYGFGDPAELVRRSFAFLLEREPSTSILREFRITEIERHFPGYATDIRRRRE